MRPAALLSLIPVVALPAFSQGGDALVEALRRQERPLLVVLPKAADLSHARAAWATLCGQEPLVEHTLIPLILNRDIQGDFARGVMQALRLPEGGWALVQKGKVLASGSGMPQAETLAESLEQAGVKPPRRLLQDFLRRHPDHLEARSQYISLLRRTAEERTRKALKLAIPRDAERMREAGGPAARLPERAWKELMPPRDKVLGAEEDVRIWAPLAQELDRLFSRGEWLRVGLEGYDSLPMEASSPLLMNLYRRHRPMLLNALRETPGDGNVLGHWVWQSRVLGEPLLPTFESLRPPVEGASSWPGTSVLKALVEEARQARDWSQTRRLLERMWRQTSLSSAWAEASMASREGAIKAREQDWSALARPYLEACLKAGELEAAAVVLDRAAVVPERDSLLASAAAMAEGQGLKAQAQAWAVWAPPKKNPLPGRLWREATLFALGATAPQRMGEYLRHDGIPELMELRTLGAGKGRAGEEEAWLRYLGWNAQEARWRVVDRMGSTLAEGVELPDAEGMVAALRQAGRVRPEERIADFLRQQPGDPQALQQRMIYALRALIRSLPPPREGEPAPLDAGQQALLEAFLAASSEAREGGWWQRPSASLEGWPHGQEAVLQVHLKEEASRWLDALDGALVQTPTAQGLWEAWGMWMVYVPDRPVQPLLDRLVLAPGSRPFTWPPYYAIQALKTQLRRKEAWTQLEALVRSTVEEAFQRAEKLKRERPTSTPWLSSEDLLWLGEALLKQGRGTDADALLQRWMALGVRLEMVHGMLVRAQRDGFSELAERWQGLVPKPTRR